MVIFCPIFSFHLNFLTRWRWFNRFFVRGAASSLRSLPRNEEVGQYLRESFDVSIKPSRILSKVCSIEDIEERVRYFQSIGLTQENIGVVFRKFPRPIMACQVEEMRKNVNFLLSKTALFRDRNILISHLIPQYPNLLFSPLEAMEKRLKLLEKCNLNDEEIARILRYNPMTILTKLENTFDDLVQYLKDCGLSDKAIHKFFIKQPRSVTYRWNAIDKRVRFFMDELGYSRQQIIQMFTNNALVLTTNVERMRQRSLFIKEEMGLTNRVFIRSPLVLRYSLGRIQWRLKYLCQIGYPISDNMHLLAIFYATDKLFAENIAKRPLDEILEFKDKISESLGVVSNG